MVVGFGKWAAKKVVDYAVKKIPRKFKVSGTIKSVPANVGSLKETKKFKESLEKTIDKADLTRKQKTEVLMTGFGKKKTKMPGMVRKFGDLEKKLKKLKNKD